MSVGDISRIESGRLRPYPSQVEKLATLLGVHRDELLQEVEGEKVATTPSIAAVKSPDVSGEG
jgi:ribosome-binding protein aMBF1 (putative translation factor)